MRFEPFHRVAEDLRREVDDLLTTVGVLCRVFGRGKSTESLTSKLEKSPGKYSEGGKQIQDAVGLRVVIYFPEDISVVEELLRGRYNYDEKSSMIDKPVADVFSVTRHNLVFKIPEQFDRDIVQGRGRMPIDATFEVQVRSLFSEGWHEVEHDLRYKRPDHWQEHSDLSRSFNGIVAALETAEWGMRTILNELAYRHYRDQNWEAMLCSALRMRVTGTLSKEVWALLDSDTELAKRLFRLNRRKIFRTLAALAPKIPLTVDNLVFLWNEVELKDDRLTAIAPEFLIDTIAASLSETPTAQAEGA